MEHVKEIHIDEERSHVLSKNMKTKTGIIHSQSDHNLILTKFKLIWSPTISNVVEVFKFSDIEGKKYITMQYK